MNSPIFNKAKQFLIKKYDIQNCSEIYTYFMTNPLESEMQILQKDPPIENLYKLIFLGSYHERRNAGSQAKFITQKYLTYLRNNIINMQLDIQSSMSIFLVMGNVLLRDKVIIDYLLNNFKQNQDQLQPKQLQTIAHCLYKLSIKNEYWQTLACQELLKNPFNIQIQDYVSYLHIASNLYYLNEFDVNNILELLDILQYKLQRQKKHLFLSKFSYQFVQLMFNIYPELIKQSYKQTNKLDENQFSNYFQTFLRDYIICRLILDKKTQGLMIDYFEHEGFANFIRIKEDDIHRACTISEQKTENILQLLNLNYEKRKKLSIYEVDFVVQNQFVINCNSEINFIQNLEGQSFGKSPNFLMQQRHLKQLGSHCLVDLDYTFWNQYPNQETQIQQLQKLLL